MNQSAGGDMIDTTDCLEAISVFRCWKNLLFVIVLLCLLLLQASFWVVDGGWVSVAGQGAPESAPAAEPNAAADLGTPPPVVTARIAEAAKEATADPNQLAQQAAQPEEPQQSRLILVKPRLQDVISFVRFLDFVLMPVAILYCLTMLFALKVSLIGRLGGINHIARAFFLSLVFTVLLLPWQHLFGPVFKGVMFTPSELISRCAADKTIWEKVFFFGRFAAYWLIALLILVFAQIRSIRWARATLKRLEVM